MKTIVTLIFGFFIILSVSGQNNEQPPTKKKSLNNQNKLVNEVFAGYNYGTLYLNNPYVDHSYKNYPEIHIQQEDANTIGTFIMGYNRRLSRVIQFGFVASYMNLRYTGEYGFEPESGNLNYIAKISDNIFSGIAMATFNYLNKPVVRLYSAVGLGATVIFSTVKGPNQSSVVKETKRQINWGGQMTLFGIRVGRSLGGFFEIGFGSNAMLSGGLSYQFGD